MSDSQQQEQGTTSSSDHGAEFTVMIIASGPLRNGGMVHAVAVTQPVQSWTVLRSHDDFYAVSDVLAQLLPAVPTCPVIAESGGDLMSVVNARNELQKWLTAVLTHPGSTETLAVRNFLTYGANIILPQFEGVTWTSFDADGSVASPQNNNNNSHRHESTATAASGNVDDMEMDDMFLAEDDGGGLEHHDNDNESDDEDEYRPSIRYKPTDEAITEEDEMEIMQLAGEVEMVEDIGSLAQSLGASHLGRSLQLQAEIATRDNPQGNVSHTGMAGMQGLNVGGASGGGQVGGGIRSAMEQANTAGLGDAFNRRPPESAPRLDSFKMIKVIGKGSFGKCYLLDHCMTAFASATPFFSYFSIFAMNIKFNLSIRKINRQSILGKGTQDRPNVRIKGSSKR